MYCHQEYQPPKDPRITHNVGYMYSEGLGVKKVHGNAFNHYKIAAGKGYSDAQFELGYMYDHGHGTEKDFAAAIKWFEKAAN